MGGKKMTDGRATVDGMTAADNGIENRLNDGRVHEPKHVSRESRGWEKDPKGCCRVAGDEEERMEIRQSSQYNKDNKAKPDNNPFFEQLSNPLSSKGN